MLILECHTVAFRIVETTVAQERAVMSWLVGITSLGTVVSKSHLDHCQKQANVWSVCCTDPDALICDRSWHDFPLHRADILLKDPQSAFPATFFIFPHCPILSHPWRDFTITLLFPSSCSTSYSLASLLAMFLDSGIWFPNRWRPNVSLV